jgi:purine nucleosidase
MQFASGPPGDLPFVREAGCMTREKIILDCDPGRDDALAIALTLASPEEIELIGITAVAGNVPLDLTQRNARLVAEICGHPEVPVHAGADRPLERAPVSARRVHGATGLDGLEVREPAAALQTRHAVDFIVETLAAAGEAEITLVAVGPLTNLALAFAKAPEVLPKVKQAVVMGGARREGGNVTPAAEFNIYADPHAAAAVFSCGRPLVVMSLDVTYRVLAGPAHARRLEATGSSAARALAGLLRQVDPGGAAKFGPERTPLHDPCTIAWLLRPDLFETRHVNAAVETGSDLTLGATVVDFWAVTDRAPNALWAHEVGGEGVLDLLIERIGRLP